jgi:hypothetical protein
LLDRSRSAVLNAEGPDFFIGNYVLDVSSCIDGRVRFVYSSDSTESDADCRLNSQDFANFDLRDGGIEDGA